jgi:4-hydroxythreonine-4-phosphate dehydrogenase
VSGMSLPLALTMGEPAGIGGEIALKAWLRRADGVPPFYLIDDPDRLRTLAARLGWSVKLRVIDGPERAVGIFAEALPVMPVDGRVRAGPGHPDPADGALVIGAIDKAVVAARAGRAAAVVTNPINKEALYRAGFHHPGHTEYLAELAGPGTQAVMMLTCPELRVVPVTIHLALRQAIETLSSAMIVAAGRVTHAALLRDFAVAAPAIAVAGLNPHAGDGGNFGREEIDIIAPAVMAGREEGIAAEGPFPADTVFLRVKNGAFDAVLTMYHDQGQIAMKLMGFDRGVTLLGGFPFPICTPAHGTAYEIAGKGIANAGAGEQALLLAARIARRQQLAHEAVG